MIWIALLLISLAIALWCYSYSQSDEVLRFIGFSLALVSLIASLVADPWPLKIVIAIALVIYPTCSSSERVIKPSCPRLCLLRHQCKSPR